MTKEICQVHTPPVGRMIRNIDPGLLVKACRDCIAMVGGLLLAILATLIMGL